MASVFRLAIGRCSCTDPQPSALRQAVCRELTRRFDELRAKRQADLDALPPYVAEVSTVNGRAVTFETIREPFPEARAIIVVRAFVHSWSWPNWISLSGVGYMFADGFVLAEDGAQRSAEDSEMWDFR